MRTKAVRIFFMVTFEEFTTSRKAARPHYLVVGHPIGHSLSPLMHRIALRHCGLEAGYLAVDLHPDRFDKFPGWLEHESFLGANVTLPFKERFIDLMDKLDRSARRSGALNTIVRENGLWTGYNTDIEGFLSPLNAFRDRLQDRTIIVFGSGGASRAVLFALQELGTGRTVLVSRTPDRVKEQIAEGSDIEVCGYIDWPEYISETVMLVNTTPLGMYPEIESSPVRDEQTNLLQGKICYDLVYNPLRTRFLQQAEAVGAETIQGLEMFIGQGARAFELWTGRDFPVVTVKQALAEELSG